MQRIAIILLCVVALLGGLLWLTRARPAPAPTPPPAWVGLLDLANVRGLRSQDGRGASAEVLHPVDDRLWLLHAPNSPGWLASTDRIRAALRLLQDAASVAPVSPEPASAEAVRVTLQIDGVGSRQCLIEPQGVGGLVRLHIPAESGDACRDCLVDAGLAQVFSPAGLAQWRDASAIWSPITDAARIRIDAGGSVLALARNTGRWTMQAPIACPADPSAVAGLAAALSSLQFQRILPIEERSFSGVDSPTAVISIETDVRVSEGGDVKRRVLVQELRIGSPNAAAGGALPALATATWRSPESGEQREAWGPLLVLLPGDALKGVASRPEGFLSRVSFQTPRADVRSLGLDDTASAAGTGAASPPRTVLTRSLDGWIRGGAALSPQDTAGLAALLTMLCDSQAATATLSAPHDARLLAKVAILHESAEVESAELYLATVPLASGPAQAIVVKVGAVLRVYPAAVNQESIDFVRRMLPAEG